MPLRSRGDHDPLRDDRHWSLVVPVHPFLFGSGFVLNLWASNLSDQVRIGDVLLVWAAVLCAVALTLGVVYALTAFRNARLAAAITTVFVVWALSFGHVDDALQSVTGRNLLLIAWVAIGIGTALGTLALQRRLGGLTGYLNVASGLLVVMNLLPIVPHQITTASTATYRPAGLESYEGVPTEIAERRPDIYYIILDRYPSEQTLASTAYDHDNSAFLGELERLGFYVAPYSHANYTNTALSLASSLSMDYLDLETMAELAPAASDWKPVHDMLAGSLAVPRLLEQQGYTHVHLPSWYEPTATGAEVDLRYRWGPFSEFADALFRSTVFSAGLEHLGIGVGENPHIMHANFQFDTLTDLGGVAGPKFVLAHILLPHPPYVFGPDGALPASDWFDGIDAPREAFVRQLEYTNRQVLEAVQQLLADPGADPIIIIQADEGPYPPHVVEDWRYASAEDYQRKFGILNAYYLPGTADAGLYPAITPVNSFRHVFNSYFNGEFPLLQDRVYAFRSARQIYASVDITERLARSDIVDEDRVAYEVSAPDRWTAGGMHPCEVVLKNTGAVTWESDGPDAVALRVVFEANDKATRLEQTFPLDRDVPPGGATRLQLDVIAPDADGDYRVEYRLAHGFSWFRARHTEQATVASTPETWERLLQAEYRFRAPVQWVQGETRSFRVRVTNEGTHRWSPSGDRPVRLGVQFGGDSDVAHDGWVTDDRFRLPREVDPGESIVVEVTVTAPDTPGRYTLRHRLVKENTAWFSSLSGVSVVVSERSDVTWWMIGLAVALGSGTAGAGLSYFFDPANGGPRRGRAWMHAKRFLRG